MITIELNRKNKATNIIRSLARCVIISAAALTLFAALVLLAPEVAALYMDDYRI